MQVAPSVDQICNLCKWRHLVVKYATNVVVQFCYQVQSKLRSQFLGPLCLWQCFNLDLEFISLQIFVILCVIAFLVFSLSEEEDKQCFHLVFESIS